MTTCDACKVGLEVMSDVRNLRVVWGGQLTVVLKRCWDLLGAGRCGCEYLDAAKQPFGLITRPTKWLNCNGHLTYTGTDTDTDLQGMLQTVTVTVTVLTSATRTHYYTTHLEARDANACYKDHNEGFNNNNNTKG